MKIKRYNEISADAMEIRQTVFVNEQGFRDEFDDIDDIATHIVVYNEEDKPIATCRIFEGEEENSYILGRFAVLKQYRGRHIGLLLLDDAEKTVIEKGGKKLCLHSQYHAEGFYKKAGYISFGEVDEEEGCPHIWMKKEF